MLTKMPKVGDVVIANEDGVKQVNDALTVGGEYVIHRIDREGDAYFYDDDGYEEFIAEDVFEGFTLKSEVQTDEHIGFIELRSIESSELPTRQLWTVAVDEVGFKAINELVKASANERKRADIQAQIDALQAELNAL